MVEDHFQAFLRILPVHSLFSRESTSLDSSLQQKGGVWGPGEEDVSASPTVPSILYYGERPFQFPEKFNHSLLFMGHGIVEIGYSSEYVYDGTYST